VEEEVGEQEAGEERDVGIEGVVSGRLGEDSKSAEEDATGRVGAVRGVAVESFRGGSRHGREDPKLRLVRASDVVLRTQHSKQLSSRPSSENGLS
jgi:hypothetical protein